MTRIFAIAALTLSVSAPTLSTASDNVAYEEAEAAIKSFRAETFLVTQCERSFADFWKSFRADGPQGLLYLTDRFGARQYFGYGNSDADDALSVAQSACREQAGRHGDMVLVVLRDRALEKEARLHQFEHAERVIGN